jgi:2-polyprenyl-6-methoxyphenol hydroxylase-like FAD-dependent oxidoreductase
VSAGSKEELCALASQSAVNAETEAVANAATRVFDWGLYTHPTMKRWSQGRVVLLGDACHATTPFVGQGANQAIMDGFSLADKLRRLQAGEFSSLEAAIGAYEAIRRPETERIVKMSAMIGAIETCRWPWSAFRDYFYGGDMIVRAMREQIKPKT